MLHSGKSKHFVCYGDKYSYSWSEWRIHLSVCLTNGVVVVTATFRLRAASLHQANVDLMSCCLCCTRWMVIGRASRPSIGCSYVGVFPGVFPYSRHPRFRDFDPVVPVDVVRVEADLDRFLDSANVPMWISVNALDMMKTSSSQSKRRGRYYDSIRETNGQVYPVFCYRSN